MKLPSFDEVKRFYELQNYSFDLKKFYDNYRNKEVNNWHGIMESIQKANHSPAAVHRVPDFKNEIPKKENDYEAIFNDLFGSRGPEEYKKFREELEMDNQIITEWRAQGISPIWSGDVDRERERRKADLTSLERSY